MLSQPARTFGRMHGWIVRVQHRYRGGLRGGFGLNISQLIYHDLALVALHVAHGPEPGGQRRCSDVFQFRG